MWEMTRCNYMQKELFLCVIHGRFHEQPARQQLGTKRRRKRKKNPKGTGKEEMEKEKKKRKTFDHREKERKKKRKRGLLEIVR